MPSSLYADSSENTLKIKLPHEAKQVSGTTKAGRAVDIFGELNCVSTLLVRRLCNANWKLLTEIIMYWNMQIRLEQRKT